MSLTREMLMEAGVSDKETLDKLMSEHGKTVENAKVAQSAEVAALKEQIEQQKAALETLQKDKETSDEAKEALEKLQADFDTYKNESEAKQRKSAITLALKDTDAYSADDLMKLIDLDAVTFNEQGEPQLAETIKELKESKPYLFQPQVASKAPQINVGGNPSAGDEPKSDPFQEIINNYQ